MNDDYFLPKHLKKILDKKVSESNSKSESKDKEKFADTKSIIDEKEMIRIVNLFLN